MNDFIEQLRASADPLAAEAVTHIAALNDRINSQQAIMDRAASIMVEATVSDDGIDSGQADECVDAIRGKFAEVGKTTAEHYLEKLYNRIGAAAGIAAGDEFDPLVVMDHIRTVLAAQSKNARYLEWALSIVWSPKEACMQLSTGCGGCGDSRTFPPGTNWMEALDTIILESAAAAAEPAAPNAG